MSATLPAIRRHPDQALCHSPLAHLETLIAGLAAVDCEAVVQETREHVKAREHVKGRRLHPERFNTGNQVWKAPPSANPWSYCRVRFQALMYPVSPEYTSWTRSFHVPAATSDEALTV
jgi:hypothetical protein